MQLPDLSLLVIMALFWATYLVLRTFVLNPLGKILLGREDATSEAAEALERAVSREKETLASVDQKLTDARREAMTAWEAARQEVAARRQALLDSSREKARAEVAEFQKKMESEVTSAREELRRGAVAIASEIAEASLGRRVA